jgi:hypothetical protein
MYAWSNKEGGPRCPPPPAQRRFSPSSTRGWSRPLGVVRISHGYGSCIGFPSRRRERSPSGLGAVHRPRDAPAAVNCRPRRPPQPSSLPQGQEAPPAATDRDGECYTACKDPQPAERPQYQSPAGRQPCVQPGLTACVPVVRFQDDAPCVCPCRRPTGEGVTYEPLDSPSSAASARLPQLCPPVRGNDEGILKEVVGRTAPVSINAYRGRMGAPWSSVRPLATAPRCEGRMLEMSRASLESLLANSTRIRCAPYAPYKKSKSRQLLCVTKERPARTCAAWCFFHSI